ncbi:hypothetical protein [Legionella yabuuchiae]|uniref:hypothetical protein n=1 Tax=Legionella yabuuchiae TaxID=376727 RepID=UPI001054EE37|nr:hypothetical protein [Legionella yabuuchiae]
MGILGNEKNDHPIPLSKSLSIPHLHLKRTPEDIPIVEKIVAPITGTTRPEIPMAKTAKLISNRSYFLSFERWLQKEGPEVELPATGFARW